MPVLFGGFAGQTSAMDTVRLMLARFRPLFGEYPFVAEKYGVYRFGFGGGMEHQTFTGQNSLGESLSAHELAHQWWGDDVTCRFWNDIWLNEGFATYGAVLWQEHKANGSSNKSVLRTAMLSSKPSTTRAQSVYVPTTTSASRLFDSGTTYSKGAWVLHMLRGLMGDTTFFNTLKAYRAMYSGSAATTADFQAVCETMSGMNLDAFFNQYVYGPGAPTYAVGFRTTVINGKRLLECHIRQTQQASFGLFDMPLQISIPPASPFTTVRVREQIQQARAILTGTSNPSSITLDPNEWVLKGTTINETYIPGAATVVDSIPAPGTKIIQNPGGTEVTIFVSEAMAANPGNFELRNLTRGTGFGVTPSYDTETHALRVRTAGLVSPGDYELVATGLVGAETGYALDGEMLDPSSATSFPSGDGIAGGVFRLRFRVDAMACPADVDRDGFVTLADFGLFVDLFRGGSTDSDFNGDGFLTYEDFDAYVRDFQQGCTLTNPI
jgi:hypothetical protein